MLAANSGIRRRTVSRSAIGNRSSRRFGAVFMVDAPRPRSTSGCSRAPDDSPDRREPIAPGSTGSASGATPSSPPSRISSQRHQAALAAFELSDRLPRHERAVQQATSELADLFCPDLLPGHRYDLASIVVPVPTAGQPPMAIRMTGLPAAVATEQIQSWVDRLTHVAATPTPRGDLTDMGMRITRLADAEAFSPPGHTGVGPLRLQGGTDTPTERLTVVLSHYLPGGRADLSPQPVETVYVLVSGELTMVSDGEEAVLPAYDYGALHPRHRPRGGQPPARCRPACSSSGR